MNDAQVKHMVDRFLSWKLPENFRPDGGVEFDAEAGIKRDPRNTKYEPYGTNLLDAVQAEAMVRHMLEGLQLSGQPSAASGTLPQFGYTGQSPEKGLVGFVNIQAIEAGVRFTVRSEGEASVTAAHDVPFEDAVNLLADAVTAFVEQE